MNKEAFYKATELIALHKRLRAGPIYQGML